MSTLTDLATAQASLEAAEKRAQKLRDQRNAAIVAALRDGHSTRAVGDACHMSGPRVVQIHSRERKG